MTKEFTIEKLKTTFKNRKKVYVALLDTEIVGTAGLDKSWYSDDEYWILNGRKELNEENMYIMEKIIRRN